MNFYAKLLVVFTTPPESVCPGWSGTTPEFKLESDLGPLKHASRHNDA